MCRRSQTKRRASARRRRASRAAVRKAAEVVRMLSEDNETPLTLEWSGGTVLNVMMSDLVKYWTKHYGRVP